MSLLKPSSRAHEAIYIRQRMDPRNNRLIRDKLRLAVQQLRNEITKATNEIRLASRLDCNKIGVEITISKMWEVKVDNYAGKCYEIFFHHWNLVGKKKTGAFVRVVQDIILRSIGRLGASAAREASRAHRRMGSIGTSSAGSYENSARALCERWRAKLEIEARELDLIGASNISSDKTPERPVEEGLNKELVTTGKYVNRTASGENQGLSSKVNTAGLQFTRRGKKLLAIRCDDKEGCIAYTYEHLLPHMEEAKSIVRLSGGGITPNDLRVKFKNTDFVKALDTADWELLIEEFSKKRPAGCRNLMLGLLARRTGKSIATIDTYTKPSRKRKKMLDQ